MCSFGALAQQSVRLTTDDFWDAALSDDGNDIRLTYNGDKYVKSVKLKVLHLRHHPPVVPQHSVHR